jgi:AraC-like DNA-binding protein
MRKNSRHTFTTPRPPKSSGQAKAKRSWEGTPKLWIDVIGFHIEHKHVVSNPWGIPAWRIMMFHQAVPLKIHNQTIVIQPQSLLIFPPDVITSYGTRDKRWQHSWLRISGDQADQIIQQAEVPFNQPIIFESANLSDHWLDVFHREMQHTEQIDTRCVSLLLECWLMKIAAQAQVNQAQHAIPQAFRHAYRYINEHYRENIKLDALANQFYLSPRYFCTRFKQYYRITPINLVMRLRMTLARDLLTDVNLQITEIAQMCGYSDVYYFSRLFKQEHGMTPSAFRSSKPDLE